MDLPLPMFLEETSNGRFFQLRPSPQRHGWIGLYSANGAILRLGWELISLYAEALTLGEKQQLALLLETAVCLVR